MMRFLVLSLAAFALSFDLASAATCPVLTRTLQRGMEGSDVRELQQFLVERGNLSQTDMNTGPGIFGSRTEAAVKQFQCAQNIVCNGGPAETGWGVVGPRTRLAIAALCSTSTNYSQASYAAQSTYTAYAQSSYVSQSSYASTGAPTVSITVNNQETEVVLNMNVIYTLNWSSSNASSCVLTTVFGTSPLVQSTTTPNASGTARGAVVDGGALYTITCSNAHGTSEKSVKVIPYGRSCQLGGVRVEHEKSAKFYSASSVKSPQTCQSVAQQRTCIDSVLSGDAQFDKASCTVETASTNTSGTAYAQASYSGGSTSGGGSCKYKGQSQAEGTSLSLSGLGVTCDNSVWVNTFISISGVNVCDQAVDPNHSSPDLDDLGCAVHSPVAAFGVLPRHGRAPLALTAYVKLNGWSFTMCMAHSINWGDGTSESFARNYECSTNDIKTHTHTYSSPGSYTISYSQEFGATNSAVIRVE